MKALLLWVVAATFASGSGRAQSIALPNENVPPPPDANAKHYTVTGTVVNSVTSEPIGRALVRMLGSATKVAFTGPDGRFEFQSVPGGNIWLSAQRPRFFSTDTRNRRSPVLVGEGANDFRVALVPQSEISGTIADSDGDPIQGIRVGMMRAEMMDGRKQWLQGGSAMTDENGEYQMDKNGAEAILICTTQKALSRGASVREVYPAHCYPNTAEFSAAQEIETAPGQSARADFTLDAVPGYVVKGTIAGGGSAVTGWVYDEAGLPSMSVRIRSKMGSFEVGPLPNGVWKFHFQSNLGGEGAEEIDQEVSVQGADVNNVAVALPANVDVPVEFVQPASDGRAQQNNASFPVVRLSAQAVSMMMNRVRVAMPYGSGQGPLHAAMRSVPPGTYNVVTQANDVCVESVTSGGLDLLEQPLTIPAGGGAQPIVVTEGSDCATLEVTVHSEHADDNANVLLVPDAPGLESSLRNAPKGEGETMRFENLRPGGYRVYALTDPFEIEYRNPEAMRDMGGQAITLAAGQKESVRLNVVGQK